MSDTVWLPLNTSFLGDGILFGVSAPSENMVYVCGEHGMIFNSTNGGDTWSTLSVPTTQRLKSICFFDEKKGFAVGDSGTILYTSNGGVTAVDEREDILVMGFTLSQNYPNPFNPSTTITYELPRASQVNLTVYDILGRQVSVLVNERRNAGVHEVKFSAKGGSASGGDGATLASGVYFYRLQAGDFVQTRRFLFLK
jgi:hypothetical protein